MGKVFTTQQGRPHQTVSNIKVLLEIYGVTIEYRNYESYLNINGRAIAGFSRQEQEIMDMATMEGFWRDGLKSAVRSALLDLRAECFDRHYAQKETAHTDEQSGS